MHGAEITAETLSASRISKHLSIANDTWPAWELQPALASRAD